MILRHAPKLLIAAILALSPGCAFQATSHHDETVMGSKCEIIIAGKTRTDREQILGAAFKILHDLDDQLSLYKPSSEISRLNREAFKQPQVVSEDTFEVIRLGAEFYQTSGGVFDITVLPLMQLWGFYGEPRLPSQEEIQKVLPQIGTDHLFLNMDNREVSFEVDGMGMDLGAIAKGYACDKVVDYLKSQGIESALVNVGGTIYALGNAPSGNLWRIGLRHPRDPYSTSKVIAMKNQAVATSGDYAQFFVMNRKRYAHIMDPRTGQTADQSVAVSVVAPSATLADLLSTSFFVLGPKGTPALAKKFSGIHWYLTYFGPKGSLVTKSDTDSPPK